MFYYFLLWFFLFAVAMVFIVIHGIDYVSWPRLNPPTDIIYYNGPGYRSGHHGKGLNGQGEPSWKQSKGLAGSRKGVKNNVEEVELGTIRKRAD